MMSLFPQTWSDDVITFPKQVMMSFMNDVIKYPTWVMMSWILSPFFSAGLFSVTLETSTPPAISPRFSVSLLLGSGWQKNSPT